MYGRQEDMSADSNSPATHGNSTSPVTGPATPRPRRRWAIWAAALFLLCGAGYLLSQRAPSGQKGSAKKGGRQGPAAIPVAVDTVRQGNLGVYINALGTVTPVYTVTVTSRVV